MNSQHKHWSQILKILKKNAFYLAALMAVGTILPFFALNRPAEAQQQTKLTAEVYCRQFTETSKNYACKDGWKGADCTDYLITHDQSHVDVCQTSARKAAEVGSGGDSEESLGVPETNNSNNTDGLDTVEDLVTQIRDSQRDYVGKSKDPINDALVNSKPDNKYGQYVNGKGDYQPLRITRKEGEGQPAIIFFNGGGWHTDDRVGDKVAPLAVQRGYTAIVATYRLGSSGVYYQFEDVMRAVKHVRDNAKMYGVDPSRIAVWGDSAGGSLAMRVAGSGKSGAAAAVGWSAPTNAYTALFKSPQSFAIGMDHSTCIPTDINGVLNAIDMLNGGEGNIPNEGGLGNNNVDSFVNGDTLGAVTEVLTLAERAQRNGVTSSSLSSGISGSSSGSGSGGGQNSRQLTSKMYLECLDNFTTLSPALYASPLTPPTFLAGFDTDILVGPDQLYQMRDKLRGMGVPSSVVTLPGVASPNTVPGENHLDYNEAFVGPSLDFLDKYLHPKK
jgi:acetyl esterase/lipase